MDWSQIATIVASGFFIIMIVITLKNNPGMLTKEKLNKSLTSMGILALALFGFISVLVMLLRSAK